MPDFLDWQIGILISTCLPTIGLALQKLPPFSDVLSEQLRAGLGDWQARLGPLPGTLLDPLTRTEFFRSHDSIRL